MTQYKRDGEFGRKKKKNDKRADVKISQTPLVHYYTKKKKRRKVSRLSFCKQILFI